MRWRLTRGAVPTQIQVETQQQKVMRLSGQVLERYRTELSRELEDPERLKAVYGESFMSRSVRDQAFVVAQMASDMLKVPNAMVNILLGDTQITIASVGAFPLGSIPASESWCEHVIGTGRELAVNDGKFHPLVCDTKLARSGEIVSYLGVPIVNREGIIVGVLCTFDDHERNWGAAEVAILTQLSMVLTRTS